jgi:hypothetical protein
MDSKKILNFISDPSHSWLEIKRVSIPNDILNEISEYSYQDIDNGLVYLEEDLDAGLYIDYLKSKGFDLEVNTTFYNDDCFVRDLQGFRIKPSENNDPYYNDIPSAIFDIEDSDEIADMWYDMFGY